MLTIEPLAYISRILDRIREHFATATHAQLEFGRAWDPYILGVKLTVIFPAGEVYSVEQCVSAESLLYEGGFDDLAAFLLAVVDRRYKAAHPEKREEEGISLEQFLSQKGSWTWEPVRRKVVDR